MSPPLNSPASSPLFDLSVVVPARDEAGNLKPLVDEIFSVFARGKLQAELVIVNDGSRDATADELKAIAADHKAVTLIHHETALGQSAALYHGIRQAAAPLIATLDADLQNDPADLPGMIEKLRETSADLIQGDRSANRRDHCLRRQASAVGRIARQLILHDPTRDTGCSTRVMRAELARRLPLDRPGMHRFIPALARGWGYRVVELPVHHRPRFRGRTKYGIGLLRRGLPGLRDCLIVRTMTRQRPDFDQLPTSVATPRGAA